MKVDLSDLKAVVCGGSDGIGEACSKILASNGASVIIIARNKDKLKKVIKELDSTIQGTTRIKLFEDPDGLKDLYDQIDKYTLKNNTTFNYLRSVLWKNKTH